MDFDDYLGRASLPPGRGRDPGGDEDLDALVKEVAKRKVQKAKMLELDKYLIEIQRDVARLKESANPGSTQNSETVGPPWSEKVHPRYTFQKT